MTNPCYSGSSAMCVLAATRRMPLPSRTMKGIILAGGSDTRRLLPIANVVDANLCACAVPTNIAGQLFNGGY
jgi:hypothetical protein